MQIQTTTQSGTTNQRTTPQIHVRNKPLQKAQTYPIKDLGSALKTLMLFSQRCRQDERLTPATQLIYRVLWDTANSSFWSDSFSCSDSELIAITHLAKQTITDSKRLLKNLGYINFSGKPSTYEIYSLLGQSSSPELGQAKSEDNNTYNTDLSKEENKQRRKAADHDIHDSNDIHDDWTRDQDLVELLKGN